MRGVLPREKEGQTQRCTKEKGIKTDTEIEEFKIIKKDMWAGKQNNMKI